MDWLACWPQQDSFPFWTRQTFCSPRQAESLSRPNTRHKIEDTGQKALKSSRFESIQAGFNCVDSLLLFCCWLASSLQPTLFSASLSLEFELGCLQAWKLGSSRTLFALCSSRRQASHNKPVKAPGRLAKALGWLVSRGTRPKFWPSARQANQIGA